MKAVMCAVALATMVLAVPAAHAQSSTTNPAAAGNVPAAPVGHRQPRAADVPKTDSQVEIDAADRALDKKIRSICRGC